MTKIGVLIFLLINLINSKLEPKQFIARQGQVSFFSYTTAENIEAKNNQVLSIIDVSNNEIAISMLMNAFVFKKSLMYEHFNASYIESDLYPKATFKGVIVDFDPLATTVQTRIIKGTLTIRNISKEINIKTKIENINGNYILTGDFELVVEDFDIKIPPIVAPNIAKIISTSFRFEYQSYEK
ncbi:YceI family protein [Flavivirga jejuensis]|uniref:YceI family protein n=1 Tax=Flavivirga jejuensis TaxID=870487 RepID=A0ABT8WR26_9FLAO|nr:YceI family protein [Flavivirga jejuensis]MDO5975475.1 YceI family protein [Flavivirga jejuensis]